MLLITFENKYVINPGATHAKFNTGRLRREVKPLILLYTIIILCTIFDKKVFLSYTFH